MNKTIENVWPAVTRGSRSLAISHRSRKRVAFYSVSLDDAPTMRKDTEEAERNTGFGRLEMDNERHFVLFIRKISG